MKNKIIELQGVWKTYDMGEVKLNALQEIDLDIGSGEFVSIMGPSGSGKSTLMNLTGCLDRPTKGKIFLDGQDISKMSESHLAATRGKKIGFVFQQFNLMPTLNALQNVMLPLEFQETNQTEAKTKATKLLNLVGLEGRAKHLPSQLSGGEKQRVAIARALATDPDIILADEPTGNLDSKTGSFIIGFLMKINREGKTLIMATHDHSIAKHANRIIHIKDAKIEKIEKRR